MSKVSPKKVDHDFVLTLPCSRRSIAHHRSCPTISSIPLPNLPSKHPRCLVAAVKRARRIRRKISRIVLVWRDEGK